MCVLLGVSILLLLILYAYISCIINESTSIILLIPVILLLYLSKQIKVYCDQLMSTKFNQIFGGSDDRDTSDGTHKQSKIYIDKLITKSIKDIPEESLKLLHPDIIEDLINNTGISISHLYNQYEQSDNFTRILNELPTRPYKRRTDQFKKILHWGQLKLILSEIEFLNIVLEQYKYDKSDKPIYIIYAGAAPGHHINYLSKLFPMMHFELYDPNDFAIIDTDMISIHVQFFTHIDAQYWNEQTDKYIAFVSDIRTEPATEETVKQNMDMQLEWWTIMNPELTMFKFRLPWTPGKTKYPKGEIYIQAFSGPTSTETRIIIKKDAPLIEYDNIHYESQCFYHNAVARMKSYSCSLGNDLDIFHDGVDNCYDCVSFIHIVERYLNVTNKVYNKQNIRNMIKQIQSNITFQGRSIYVRTKVYLIEEILRILNVYKINHVVNENIKKYISKAGPLAIKIKLKNRSSATNEKLFKHLEKLNKTR